MYDSLSHRIEKVDLCWQRYANLRRRGEQVRDEIDMDWNIFMLFLARGVRSSAKE